MSRSPFRNALLAAILICVFVIPASAGTITWTGNANDGSWHSASNWDLGRVPATGDDVVIPDLSGTSSVAFTTGSTTIASLSTAESFNKSGGTLTVVGAASFTALNVSSNTLELNGATSISSLTFTGGEIQGVGDITVTTAFDWTNGLLGGSRTITLAAGVHWTFNVSSNARLIGPTLVNNGTCTFAGSGYLPITGSTFRNASGAVLDITGSGAMLDDFASASLVNEAGAVLRKSGGGPSLWYARIISAGTIEVQSGTFRFNGLNAGNVHTISGAINAAAGTILDFSARVNLEASASLVTAGTLLFTNSTQTIDAATFSPGPVVEVSGGTVNLNVPATFSTLNVSGGELAGTGNFTVTAAFNWNGPITGNRTITIPAALHWTVAANTGARLSGPTLVNNGTCTLTGNGHLPITGSTFRNASGALLDITGGGAMLDDFVGAALVNEAGAVVRKSGGGPSLWYARIISAGTIEVQSGTFRFNGLNAGGSHTISGAINTASGTTLDFSGRTNLESSASLVTAGLLLFSNSTQTIDAATFSPGPVVEVSGGTVQLNVPTSFSTLNLGPGDLSGSGAVTVTDSMHWSGGTISGDRTFTIAAGATWSTSGGVVLSPASVVNRGHGTLTGSGNLTLFGSSFGNASGGTFEIQADGGIAEGYTGGTFVPGSFSNEAGALFVKSGAGTSAISGFFYNAGRARLLAGQWTFNHPVANQEGGVLDGNGTIAAGTLNNSGHIGPGTSPGAISVIGNVTQGTAGVLDVELGGTGSPQYDRLDIGGSATLAGALDIAVIDGFTPTPGDTFRVLTFGSRSGTFAQFHGLEFGSVAFQPAFDATGLTLRTIVNTAPSTHLTGGPTNGAWNGSSSATFAWTGTDDTTPTDSLEFAYKVDNGAYTVFARITTAPLTALSEGFHEFTVKARDRDGEEELSPEVVQFRVDTTAPNVTFTNVPAPGASVPTSSVSIGWSGTDNFTPGDSLQYTTQLDGNAPVVVGGVTSATLTLAEGPHTFTVSVRDLASLVDPTPASVSFAVAFVDLTPIAFTVPASGLFDTPIAISFEVRNSGAGTATGSWVDSVYLSTDAVVGGDTPIASIPHSGAVGNGASYTVTQNLTVPAAAAEGSYRLVVVTDATGHVHEQVGETNNGRVSAPITLTFPPHPDLRASSLTQPSSTGSGLAINVEWTVSNAGTTTATAPWTERVYLSADSLLGSDALLVQISSNQPLAPGQSFSRIIPVTVPDDTSGDFRILVLVDGGNQVTEYDAEGNNVVVSPTPLHITLSPQPDLIVSAVNAPSTATGGQHIQVAWTVNNVGGAATNAPAWFDKVYLSLDATLSNDDISLGKFQNPTYVPAGEGYTNTVNVTVPYNAGGNRCILVVVDGDQQVAEHTREGNNVGASNPVSVTLVQKPVVRFAVQYVAPFLTGGQSGEPFTATWITTNIGALPATCPRSDWLMVSASPLGTSHGLVEIGNRPALAPGASDTVTVIGAWPSVATEVDYYAIAEASLPGNVQCAEPGPSAVRLVHIVPKQPSDLMPTAVSASPATLPTGTDLSVHWIVSDEGLGRTASGSWTDSVYLSMEPALNVAQAIALGERKHFGVLAPGDTYTDSLTAPIPSGPGGFYYVYVRTDARDNENEVGYEGNNIIRGSLQVHALSQPPDLVATALSVPAAAGSGKVVGMAWTVTNSGIGNTVPTTWVDKVYLSTDAVFTPAADSLLATRTHGGALAPSQSYRDSSGVTLPNGLAGSFHVFVQTDAASVLFESGDDAQNISTATLTMTLSASPDLQVTAIVPPVQPIEGTSATVQWTIKNRGAATTGIRPWLDNVYLSTDSTLETSDALLTSVQHATALNPNGTYSVSQSVVLPSGFSGPHMLLVQADVRDTVYEYQGEGNNLGVAAVMIDAASAHQPDLTITAASATDDGVGGVTASWTVHNGGVATQAAQSIWVDRVYLSTDGTLDAADVLLGYVPHTGGVAAASNYTGSRTFALPNGINGPRVVLVVVDAGQVVTEANEGNNQASAAVTIQVHPVNLIVVDVEAPATAISGQPITVSWQILNFGAAPAAAKWSDGVYVSRDQVFDETDVLLGNVAHTGTVGPGADYYASLTAAVPLGLVGDYFVFVKTDNANEVFEFEAEGNNASYRPDPVSVTLPLPVDLVASGITAPASVPAGGLVSLSWVITNQSANTLSGVWTDAAYLSADAIWDIDDPQLGQVSESQALASHASVTRSLEVTAQDYQRAMQAVVPGVNPDAYFVIVRADVRNNIYETDESNNAMVAPSGIDVTVQDLPIDTDVPFVIASNRQVYYHVQLNGDQDMRVRLSIPTGNLYTLFSRGGAVPDRITFATEASVETTQDIVLATLGQTDVFLMVLGDRVIDAGACTIRVTPMSLSLASVLPGRVGDNGQVTLALSGAGFAPGMLVELVGPDTIRATTVFVDKSTAARARFTFARAPHGAYDLIVTMVSGVSYSREQAIVIETAQDFSTLAVLDKPPPTRVGTPATFVGTICNRGNIDLPYVTVVVGVQDQNVDMVVTPPEGALPRLDPIVRDSLARLGEDVKNLPTRHGLGKTEVFFYLRDLPPGSSAPFAVTVRNPRAGNTAVGVVCWPMGTEMFLDSLLFTAEQQRRLLMDNHEIISQVQNTEDLAILSDAGAWAKLVLNGFYRSGLIDSVSGALIDDVVNHIADAPIAQVGIARPDATDDCGGECVVAFQDNIEDCQSDYYLCFRKCIKDLRAVISLLTAGAYFVYCVDDCQATYDVCVRKASRGMQRCSEGSGLRGIGAAFDDPAGGGSGGGAGGSSAGGCMPGVGSRDPNEKMGPTAASADPVVRRGLEMPYTIYFQNQPSATAPALVVDVQDEIDPDLDVRKFRLTDIAFGSIRMVVPAGLSHYRTRVTLADGNLLEIEAGVNANTRVARWTLTTLDPRTGVIPTDPSAGFLPPDDSTGVGQGHVGFTIAANPASPEGAEITNSASIVFDKNAPIITNTVDNTIRDAFADLAIANARVAAGDSAVVEGWPAAVTATVTNVGEVAAAGLDVRVFDGDPDDGGVLVGTAQVLSGLPIGASSEVTVPWIPSRVQGNRFLFVVADRANTIPESNEGNNTLGLTAAVAPRNYTLHLAAGVNLVAPPLDVSPAMTARSFASALGACLIVRVDSAGAFKPFLPGIMVGDGFAISGSTGYLVVTDHAGSATFSGVSHRDSVSVRKGLNLLSLPLDSGAPYTASQLATALGASQVTRFDAGGQRFDTYVRGFTPGEGFAVQGGRGYLAVADAAKSAVFSGVGWNGDGAPADALKRGGTEAAATPLPGATVLGVAGDLFVKSGWSTELRATGGYAVEIRNARTGAVATAQSNPDGQYAALFMDAANGAALRAGDELQLLVRDSKGALLSDTTRYLLSPDDTQSGCVNVTGILNVPPVFSLLFHPYPEPFSSRTHIRFQLARKGHVSMRVYDVAGRLVRTIVDTDRDPGYYEESWSGQSASGHVSSGIYYLRFEAPNYASTKRITLIR